MEPIKEKCSEGIKLVRDMDGEVRTYLMKMNFICNKDHRGNYAHIALYSQELPITWYTYSARYLK